MSNSLMEAAHHIPLCLHELTRWHKLNIALLRSRVGLDLYPDLKQVLKQAENQICAPLRLPAVLEPGVELAGAARVLPKFTGVVHLGIGVDHDEVETWVAGHSVGHALSDPGFLSGSISREVALQYGGAMLLRLLSCSGAAIWLISDTPQELEVVFAPGERFIIVSMQRHNLGRHGRIWVVDAEEMSWPSRNLPHWPEYDS
jgi:NAD:arginine ADP-ribosyltransferase